MFFNRSLDQSPDDGFFASVPTELRELILDACSNAALFHLRGASSSFRECIDNRLIQKSGAESREEFFARLKRLKSRFILQELVLQKQMTLALAEETKLLLDLPQDQRREKLSNELIALPPLRIRRRRRIDPLLSDGGIIAYKGKFITLEQVVTMPLGHVDYLLGDNGLQALREKLITPEQVAKMPLDNRVAYLFRDSGLRALREGLITPEQVAALPSEGHFAYLLRDNGLQALREKLITPGQVAKMPSGGHVDYLLRDTGLQALREGLITPEQAVTVSRHLPSLLSDQGLKVLREQLIVPEQLAGISDTCLLKQLLSKDSESLRRGLTPKYAVNIPGNSKYWSTFDNEDLPPNVRKTLSKLTELFKAIKDKNIQPKSEAAYLFIKECLLEYSRADSGHPIPAGAMRLLSGHPRRHHAAMVEQLLLKPAYQGSFDNQTLTEFLRQLKASMLQANIGPYKIAPHSDLRAILVVTRFLVDINFNTLQPSVDLDPSSTPPRPSNM